MTIQQFQNIAKKELSRTMEGLMAMLEQVEAAAPAKQKRTTKKVKSKARLHSKF